MLKPYPKEELERMSKREIIRLYKGIVEQFNNAGLVRHGHWEMKPDPYGFFDEVPVCSECGCITKWREKYPYCPNCGADMRGEKVVENESNNL